MSLIITATDFSATATNAIHYSCNLAIAQRSDVLLIHSFIFPVMFNDLPLPATMIDDTQKDAEQKMNILLDNLRSQYYGINITGSAIYGNIIDAIDESTENSMAPWLIVIGNSNTAENSTWFESTLKEASKMIRFPLLAIPPQVTFKPIRKICFAIDNNPKGSDMALVQLRETVLQLNAQLHIFNSKVNGAEKVNSNLDDHTKELLLMTDPVYHFEYDTDIDKAIINYNTLNDIDWLVIMPRSHSFIEGLFHKSHTKTIAEQSEIPILLLHENDVA